MSEPSESQIDHPRRPAAPLVVVVTQLPASGKTSVALEIAAHHRLPLLCKDQVKEILFETLGWSDRAWSRRLGRTATAILLEFVRSHARVGLPCIVESNFPPESADELRALQQQVAFRPFQVVCRARGDVLYARFLERSGRRHPGHGDDALAEELRPTLLRAAYEPLAIGGELWALDSTLAAPQWGQYMGHLLAGAGRAISTPLF